MARQPNEPAFGGLYSQAIRTVAVLALIFAGVAVALDVYAGVAGSPEGAFGESTRALWHLATTALGGLVGLITGPGLARSSRD